MLRYPIKIIIRKSMPTRGDWNRYREAGRILIGNAGNPIQTEGQLAYYIKVHFGIGRFSLLGFQKGHEGFWQYWLGDILENGYVREVNKNKEVEKLKGEFERSKDFEEKEMLEEFIQFEKELCQEEKKTKRRGPLGILPRKPGQINEFEEF